MMRIVPGQKVATGSLAVAVALLLAAPSLVAQDDAENPFQSRVDVRDGRDTFNRYCSRCHGLGATGGETGPDLTQGNYRHSRTDTGLFMTIQRGVDGTEMPPFRRARADVDIWQVVAYLRSLTGGPRVEVPGDTTEGRATVEARGCLNCHMIDGVGGRQGPDLSTIGSRRSPGDLRSDLTEPNERVQPGFWRMNVTHLDGTVVRGRRMGEGTYSVRILDRDGNMWTFEKAELAEMDRVETSIMPSFADRLSETEMDNVIAYLYGLTRAEEGS